MREVGRRKLCHFIIFSKNLPRDDCFGTEDNEIIKAFVCLINLSNFLMRFGTGKIVGLEFTMALAASVLLPH